jgi:putative mRNA 3-end processing factor
MKATVTSKGAVLLGKYVACDAFNENMPLRVVTHAHADHMTGLRRSLRTCENVLMTRATKDLIDVLQGPLFLMSGYVEPIKYRRPLQYKDEQITFFKADHILGAAQVLVEDAEGLRIVFTGDFRINETPVLEADVLVMEATYGTPSRQRSFKRNVKDLLVSLVKEGLQQGPVYVFGYHGKIQEVMQILHNAGIKAPFIVPERVFHVSKICEMHGMRLGRLILSSEKEVKELARKNSSYVAFWHMASRKKVGLGCLRIYVSGWQFSSPCREIAENEYVIALSDHSDFKGLVEYVRLSKPKILITDGSRAGHAERLADEIHKRFGITAFALPKT